MPFVPGTRWHSLTEPELGPSLVEAIEGRQVVIAYPARAVVRRYAAGDPPLERARGHDGTDFPVEEVVEAGDLLLYPGDGQELSEAASTWAARTAARARPGSCRRGPPWVTLCDSRRDLTGERHQGRQSTSRTSGRPHRSNAVNDRLPVGSTASCASVAHGGRVVDETPIVV